ncbi:MAG: hypothetical protein RL431_308 [Actinomycetota bacterium]|jgi:hypothetical protein
MTRTRPLVLVLTALVGAPVGYLLDHVLVSNGGSVYAVPWSFTATLVLFAVVIAVLGFGVRRSLTPGSAFRELRGSAVTVLRAAKAMAIAGSFEVGYLVGFLVFMITRPVVPEFAVPPAAGGAIASVLVVIAALIAERFCEVPPADSETDSSHGEPQDPTVEPAC